MRRLIVNADDFGFTSDVNHGIIEAHRKGILTATTLMANGPAFCNAIELACSSPALDVGCHLVLVGGQSVSQPGRELPPSVKELLRALLDRAFRKWVQDEFDAQVRKLVDAGIAPSHLDTHKHTHIAPPVLDAVCRTAERFNVPWVRRPFDLPLKASAPLRIQAVNAGLRGFRRSFDRTLRAHHCRTTDHFAGFQLTGAFRANELAALVRSLPDGLTEFMCHPGYCTDELRASPTRLKESRQGELEALTSPEVQQALAERKIELTSFRELPI